MKDPQTRVLLTPVLDKIVDVVLAYRPKSKTKKARKRKKAQKPGGQHGESKNESESTMKKITKPGYRDGLRVPSRPTKKAIRCQ